MITKVFKLKIIKISPIITTIVKLSENLFQISIKMSQKEILTKVEKKIM